MAQKIIYVKKMFFTSILHVSESLNCLFKKNPVISFTKPKYVLNITVLCIIYQWVRFMVAP